MIGWIVVFSMVGVGLVVSAVFAWGYIEGMNDDPRQSWGVDWADVAWPAFMGACSLFIAGYLFAAMMDGRCGV